MLPGVIEACIKALWSVSTHDKVLPLLELGLATEKRKWRIKVAHLAWLASYVVEGIRIQPLG